MNIEAPKPYLTIKPRSGLGRLNLRELWQFRDLLMTLAGRDIKLRYRQSVLGVIWVILQPLAAAIIFAFVFGTVAHLPMDGFPPIVFVFAGQVIWGIFSNTLTKGSMSLVQNANLVSKIFFPRLVLPLSTVPSTLLDFAVSLSALAVVMAIHGIVPGIGILLLPLWLLLALALSVGVSLYAAALMVSYRDVQYAIPVLIPLLMYISPIGYSLSIVPERYQAIYCLNPLVGLIEAFRWSLLGGGHLSWPLIGYTVVVTLVIFIGGALTFQSQERRFADVI